MKNFKTSTQFKKDLKRYKNNPQKLAELKVVLTLLKNEQTLPAKYLPHMLHGEYKGCMECHIQGVFLLIWIDEEHDIIELLRIGTHSELFRK